MTIGIIRAFGKLGTAKTSDARIQAQCQGEDYSPVCVPDVSTLPIIYYDKALGTVVITIRCACTSGPRI